MRHDDPDLVALPLTGNQIFESWQKINDLLLTPKPLIHSNCPPGSGITSKATKILICCQQRSLTFPVSRAVCPAFTLLSGLGDHVESSIVIDFYIEINGNGLALAIQPSFPD